MPAHVRTGRTGRCLAALLAALATAVTVLAVISGMASTAGAARFVTRVAATRGPDAADAPAATPSAAGLAVPAGLGPGWAARLAGHSQVVIASGADWSSPHAAVTVWQRTTDGWVRLAAWGGWNGSAGWTTTPAEGLPRSPVGIFGLTDAGGYASDPGSQLPYDHDRRRYSLIFNGVRAFNHVIAINYNRVPGTVPANPTRPLGYAAGGGFWIHTQHNSGTNGCVAIPDEGVVQLQRILDPAAKPVIIMGPATVLTQ